MRQFLKVMSLLRATRPPAQSRNVSRNWITRPAMKPGFFVKNMRSRRG